MKFLEKKWIQVTSVILMFVILVLNILLIRYYFYHSNISDKYPCEPIRSNNLELNCVYIGSNTGKFMVIDYNKNWTLVYFSTTWGNLTAFLSSDNSGKNGQIIDSIFYISPPAQNYTLKLIDLDVLITYTPTNK